MSIRVTIRKDHLPQVEKAVMRGGTDLIDDVLKDGLKFIRAGMEASMPPPSSPGQMPAIRTGTLYTGVHTRKTGPMKGEIYVNTGYDQYLEYGTSKMRPRPFMRPTGRMLRNDMKIKARTYKGKIERAAG